MIRDIVFEYLSVDVFVDESEIETDFPVVFDEGDVLDPDFGEVYTVVSDKVPRYDGDHEITPSFADQLLDTSGLMLEEDIRIEPIPIARVTNTSGGTTVIIGG